MEVALLLMLTLLFTKHFVVDFMLQTPYQYLNKGNYGHTGGIVHSGLHAVATLFIIGYFDTNLAMMMAVLDFVIHYHVDWAKVQINSRYNWKADTHKEFWWLLGLDQFLHALTYLGIAYVMVTF